jgi:DNA polymerase zeta
MATPELSGEATSSTSSLPTPFFRLRLINIDHVLTRPGPLDRTECAFNPPGQPLLRVPVLRVFGATPAGQRVCAHFHGVFPYCYVEYKDSLEPKQVLAFIHRLGRDLNASIAASLRRSADDIDKAQFIAAIHLCKGVPFYGYHVGWRYFLKIYFVDPSQNVRIATILQSGKIMGLKMQPYEVHIRYNLQFMLDYNLFGCDYIDIDRIAFRQPVPAADVFRSQESRQDDEQRKQWNSATINEVLIQSEQVGRQSYCELEMDVQCADILNRRRLRRRNIHQTFDETDKRGENEKLVPSLTGLWEEEQVRRINAGMDPSIPTPDSFGDQRELAKDEAPDWLATERLRGALAARLSVERQRMKIDDKFASTYTKTHPLDSHIVTTFDSVSLLHDVQRLPRSFLEGGQDTFSAEKRKPPTLADAAFNLEKSLSQSYSHSQSQPSSLGSSPLKSEVAAAVITSASDHDSDESKIDVRFFSSQGFQQEMNAAEKELLRNERADDEDSGDEEEMRRKAQEDHSSTPLPSRSSTASPAVTPTNRKRKGPSSSNSNTTTPTASPSSPKLQATSTTKVRFANGAAPRKRQRNDTSLSLSLSTSSSSSLPSSSLQSNHSAAARQTSLWTYQTNAPTTLELTRSFAYFGLPIVEHKDPWFSSPADVPKAREYAGRTFTFTSLALSHLPDFETGSHPGAAPQSDRKYSKAIRSWTYGKPPPSRLDVDSWLNVDQEQTKRASKARQRRFLSQQPSISQPSLGFKLSQRDATSLVDRGKQHMTILAVEVMTCTRGKLYPDPAKDAIQAIAYSFQHEDEMLEDTGSRVGLRTGLILLEQSDMNPARLGLAHLAVEMVSTELDMFNALVDLVRAFDPEIVVGYEIHSSSWGYIFERAAHEYDFDLVGEVGRVNVHNTGSRNDMYGATQYSALRLSGRHTLNLWRLMRSELTLNRYSYENVVFHLLRRRVAKFDWETLTRWYQSSEPRLVSRALLYWVERVEMDLEMIETSELVFRTAEFARIYGVDFFSVISRGSQFKVESVMFRIAKPESFVLPSPSQQQVGTQNAAEDLPLVMEPLSAFYNGPVLVLDFQSLYPSIMIAYNICYSTCLGRVSKFRDSWKLGYTTNDLPRGLLTLLEKDCFVSPNGMLYVKSKVRKSLLSKMLTEILDTRVMIKASTKGRKHDKAFLRLQNARQLSIKLLANVTYGYTSASFSGRMPCVEIADSIVRYGRETLEKAIDLIHSVSKWGAQVVYGDTDSLFIYLENRTKEEAFQIGNEIANAVTKKNPKPVKLKFEKVYLPCVLMAKKRYVGYMYETQSDEIPVFNAKGIETVRRDGFPAQQRMVEACIRILFRTSDLSLVKSYCQRQWLKILHGEILMQDFIFAKEVKLGSYSENGVPPPGAALAAKKMLIDKRNESQYGERVPYLISQGPAKARLVDLARDPLSMLHDPRQSINAQYYITRGLIPPLTRIFNLMGADVESWFREMPKTNSQMHSLSFLMRNQHPLIHDRGGNTSSRGGGKERLVDHYRSEVCLVCRRTSDQDVCIDCRSTPAVTTYTLQRGVQNKESRVMAIDRICTTCSHSEVVSESTECVNIDCPMLYEKAKTNDEMVAQRDLLNTWSLISDESKEEDKGKNKQLEW